MPTALGSVPHSSASVGVARGHARRMRESGSTPAQVRDGLAARGFAKQTIDEAITPPAPPAPAPAAQAPAPASPTPPAQPQGPPSTPSGGSTGGGRRSVAPRAVTSASGALFAAMLYPVGLAYLRGGGSGVKALLKAKFLNQVPSGSSGGGVAKAPATTGSTGGSAFAGAGAGAGGTGGSSSGSW